MQEELFFQFDVSPNALKLLTRAVDKYIEKWPGGTALEQEQLKEIQLGLRKALLDCQIMHEL